jgi:site-specific recombinase XerD
VEDAVSRVRVRGPLEPHAERFAAWLAEAGYTPSSAAKQVQVLAHLSRWLGERDLGPEGLADGVAAEFAAERHAAGYRQWISLQGLGPLLGCLRGAGVVPGPDVPAPGPADALLRRYRRYLAAERGLSDATIRMYSDRARLFLSGRKESSLAGLTAAEVTAFTLAECRKCRTGAAKALVTALRSMLRFLAAEGIAPPGLDAAVPTVAWRRDSGLPQALPAGQVPALLASCDRGTRTGLRDFAVLTLLSRLGLRAGEAAALELGDIDWRAGTIMVRGKGRRDEQLPLPADAGQALAAWLRDGRPPGFAGRRVFTTMRAPLRGMSASAAENAVRRACERAGVPPAGAHRLRHTAAAGMLAAGAGLEEIGQVLRHRSAATTAIYAKADHSALAALAVPWPGGAA